MANMGRWYLGKRLYAGVVGLFSISWRMSASWQKMAFARVISLVSAAPLRLHNLILILYHWSPGFDRCPASRFLFPHRSSSSSGCDWPRRLFRNEGS